MKKKIKKLICGIGLAGLLLVPAATVSAQTDVFTPEDVWDLWYDQSQTVGSQWGSLMDEAWTYVAVEGGLSATALDSLYLEISDLTYEEFGDALIAATEAGDMDRFIELITLESQLGSSAPQPPDQVTIQVEIDTETTSAEATATQSLRTSVSKISGMISKRTVSAISPAGFAGNSTALLEGTRTGLAAGDGATGLGIWGNASYTETEDDRNLSRSESELRLGLLGIDYRSSANMIIGVAVGFEETETDTFFNFGNADSDGITIAPYFGWLITEWLSLDMTAGYSWLDNDQDRLNGIVTSDFDSERYFAAVNVTGYHTVGNWNFSASTGFRYAKDDQDSYRESDGSQVTSNETELSTIIIGCEIGYVADHIEPYLNASYEYDTDYDEIRGNSYDRDAVTAAIGARIMISDNLNCDFQVSRMFGRSSQEESSFIANLRYEF